MGGSLLPTLATVGGSVLPTLVVSLWEGACSRRKRPLNGAFLHFWGAERCIFRSSRHEFWLVKRRRWRDSIGVVTPGRNAGLY